MIIPPWLNQRRLIDLYLILIEKGLDSPLLFYPHWESEEEV